MSSPKPSSKSKKPKSDPVQSAVEAIAKWLSTADRTEVELRERLERRLTPPEVADAALERAKAYGWLDDKRVAERQAEKDRDQRLLGRGRVEQRLLKRGVEPELLEETLREPAELDAERAVTLLRSQGKRWDSVAAAARGLASRGYDEEAIRAALDSVFPGWEFGEPQDPHE